MKPDLEQLERARRDQSRVRREIYKRKHWWGLPSERRAAAALQRAHDRRRQRAAIILALFLVAIAAVLAGSRS